jgi:hypothetical protein
MNKNTKQSQIIEAIALADAEKIGFGGNFIFGDPAETTETVSETMDFFSRHCLDAHISLGHVHPYPGSELFDKCIEKGIIRNRLDFYEHIEEVGLNMTSIPDRLWIPIADRLDYLGTSFPWVKSTEALRFVKEPESASNPMVLHSGQSIWQVWARCPHCGSEVSYRQPLDNIQEKQAGSFFAISRKLFLRILESYRQRSKSIRTVFYNLLIFILQLPQRMVRKITPFFIVRRHPIFKLLDRLEAGDKRAPLSFITGCPHCNKRFRLNLPIRTSGDR